MLRFLFAEPLLQGQPGRLELHDIEGKDCLLKSAGLKRWQVWIQQEMCIHYVECQNSELLFTSFRQQISQQNLCALKWHQLMHHLTGTDFTQQGFPKIHQVLELNFEGQKIGEIPRHPYCYALPLLPSRLKSHYNYCNQAMHEKREATAQACVAFGMLSLHKCIQEINGSNYILYFQEMKAPLAEVRAHFSSLKDHPKALEATRSLREDTGLSFEELAPETHCVCTLE